MLHAPCAMPPLQQPTNHRPPHHQPTKTPLRPLSQTSTLPHHENRAPTPRPAHHNGRLPLLLRHLQLGVLPPFPRLAHTRHAISRNKMHAAPAPSSTRQATAVGARREGGGAERVNLGAAALVGLAAGGLGGVEEGA